MLEMFSVPYIPVESLSMQERVRLFERVLSLAGHEQRVSSNGSVFDSPRLRTQNGASAEKVLN